jgi:translation initiation factor 4E
MLAAIGETFETPLAKEGEEAPAPLQSDLVTGVICSARPGLLVSIASSLTASYRLAIWTREAPDVTLSEENELMRRMMTIGRHFKVSVLGYELDQKLVTGGFQTEVGQRLLVHCTMC